MKKISRRQFLRAAAAGSLVAFSGISSTAWGAINAHVVIVGGGTGGATAAKYLKKADSSIRVTIIEKNPRYYTCYMSNEVLGGDRDLESLAFDYESLKNNYGVEVIQDEVVAIEPDTKKVITAGGQSIAYDRCIVSPGIDFHYDLIEGYDETVAATSVFHAWKAGEQTIGLRNQLEAMPNGGTFVMTAPPNPYRCPPAPYERASQVAHYFKHHKPNSKVIMLDPKSGFAKQDQFEEGWMKLYGYGTDNSLIEWVSGADNLATSIDAQLKTVTTAGGSTLESDVLNIIPAQKAGKIAFTAGLTDDTGWCPIQASTFESTIHPNIHVIGDASIASPLPKSGFAANSEAKACALAIAALLNGHEPVRTSFTNGCYSVVGEDYAISIVAVYQLSEDGNSIEKIPNAGGATPLGVEESFHMVDVQYAYSWYNNFTKDVFL